MQDRWGVLLTFELNLWTEKRSCKTLADCEDSKTKQVETVLELRGGRGLHPKFPEELGLEVLSPTSIPYGLCPCRQHRLLENKIRERRV